MPEPLQTFRAVEGASPAYTAAVTLASQPFVLHFATIEVTGTGTAATLLPTGTSWPTLPAERFRPWVQRNDALTYPVQIPNAYDRVYVYPVYTTSTDDVEANIPTITPNNGFTAPLVLPFGLQPETRGFTTANKLNPKCCRLPEDVLLNVYPGAIYKTDQLNTRTNGLWSLLPHDGVNDSVRNGMFSTLASVGSGRTAFSGSNGTGGLYQLPNDFTISSGGVNALNEGVALAGNNTMSIFGMGQQFQTLGSEELVLSIGRYPSFTWNHAGVNTKKYRVHLIMMGVFLG